MNEKAMKNYLGTIEAAKSLGDVNRSAEIFEKARTELYKGEGIKKAAAPAPGSGNTYYEELCCVGFYPQERRLEAVLNVKQPYGYGGTGIGTYEYVGFWVNWNGDGDFTDTGEDVGSGYVSVLDPTSINHNKLSLCYAVYRDIIPLPTLKPGTIVRVRAILSWQVKPTGPNFVPVWGNRMECNIRIDPMQ